MAAVNCPLNGAANQANSAANSGLSSASKGNRMPAAAEPGQPNHCGPSLATRDGTNRRIWKSNSVAHDPAAAKIVTGDANFCA